jgi:hypothetical protein
MNACVAKYETPRRREIERLGALPRPAWASRWPHVWRLAIFVLAASNGQLFYGPNLLLVHPLTGQCVNHLPHPLAMRLRSRLVSFAWRGCW